MYPDQFNRAYTELIDAAFGEYGARVCIKDRLGEFSYAAVDALSAMVANKLIGRGFTKGMQVAVYSRNSAMSFIVALGVIRAGGVWIPVNDRNTLKANASVLGGLGCSAMFFERDFEQVFVELRERGQCLLGGACLDGAASAAESLQAWLLGADTARPAVSIEGTDALCLPQTGGTTGAAKGVILSHRNFCSIAHVAKTDSYELGGTMLCAAPLTHVGGRMILATLPLGYRYVVLEKIEPLSVLKTIETEQITHVFLPPTAIYALLDHPSVGEFDLSSLLRIHYTSAPISPERLEEAIDRFGPILQGGYSQTECPMSISCLRPEEHFVDGRLSRERLKSVGRANTGTQIAIVDEGATPLGPMQVGEIAVKSGSACEGYFGDPAETQKIKSNGWHLTGDVGYLDREGFLFIVDRKKDMIITGGFNVYSAEVEQVIMAMPGVLHVAVVGLPNEKWGEEVSAFVEARPGWSLSGSEIIDYCKSVLGSVKAPKKVEVVDSLPRTPVGKIDKKSLRRSATGAVTERR